MIAIRPIAACGPITDCSICPPDIGELTVYWESSSVGAEMLELGNGCLICVPNYCDNSVAYAYPLDLNCPNTIVRSFNCSDEELFETVVCAYEHNNYIYAPPCGPTGSRGQWVKETYCCSKEAA